MIKRLLAVVVGVGFLYGCSDAPVSMVKSGLMPDSVQEASLKGTAESAVMTLATRHDKHVFSGVISEDSVDRIRFEGKLQNSEQVVDEEFILSPYHMTGVWVCDGCDLWTDSMLVLMVKEPQ